MGWLRGRQWIGEPPTSWRSIDWSAVALVAVACIALFPPRPIEGKVSALEVSLLVLAVALALMLVRDTRIRSLRLPTVTIALVVYLATTAAWSQDRVQTLRDVVTLLVLLLAAVVLAGISNINSLAIGVATSGVLLLLASVAYWLVDPTHATTSSGALMGVFGNRNGLAYCLLQSIPALLAMRLPNRLGMAIKSVLVTAVSAGIVATNSKTSLLVLVTVLFLALVVVAIRRRRWLGFAVLSVGASCVAIGIARFDLVLEYLGKDSSVNGRVPMWDAILPLIAERPIGGAGWSLAWPVGGRVSTAVSESLNGVVLFHAHNEVLNWAVTSGVIGVTLVAATYAFVVWRGLALLRADIVAGSWLLLGATALVLRGLSEISETAPQGWFVLMLLAAIAANSLPTNDRARAWLFVHLGERRAQRVEPRTQGDS